MLVQARSCFLKNCPIAKRSKVYCESGQVLKRKIGRTCCRSCSDKLSLQQNLLISSYRTRSGSPSCIVHISSFVVLDRSHGYSSQHPEAFRKALTSCRHFN